MFNCSSVPFWGSNTIETIATKGFDNKLLLKLFCFQGKMVDLPEDEDTPEKRVDKIFQKMDKVMIM